MNHVVELSGEQPSAHHSNPRSAKKDLRHNPEPDCNKDYRYLILVCTTVFHGTHTYTIRKIAINVIPN